MNIAIISQLYWPEKAAASNRIERFATSLVEHHNVTILCGIPNYPSGKIYHPYKLRWEFKEKKNGVNIIRSWTVPAENKGFFKRTLNYLSFFFSGFINGLRNFKGIQVIIASTPHLLNGLLGLIIAKIKRAKFVLDVRDLWPDSLITLKLIKKGFFSSILYALEKLIYSKASRIVVVSEGMRKLLIDKKVEKDKIVVIPNAVDVGKFKPIKIDRSEFNLPSDKIIACYAGNHSRAQNIGGLFKAVIESHNKNFPIFFLFIGEGEEKEQIVNQAREYSLSNIEFIPNQSISNLIKYINAADVCLVSLYNSPFFYHALPTKTLEFMACAKPIIFFGNSFFADIIEEEMAGRKVSSDNPDLLVESIMDICSNTKRKLQFGNRAREYVSRNYTLTSLGGHLNNLIKVE